MREMQNVSIFYFMLLILILDYRIYSWELWYKKCKSDERSASTVP
jgi:cytochrome bd-type quinol oxidase subunit 2